MTAKRNTLNGALVAVFLTLAAHAAHADANTDNFLGLTGCGRLYTNNYTNNWVWVTIYDTAKVTHMDWGWVAPHTTRSWTGGGSPPPFNTYYCGFYYFIRGEVKAGGPADTPNIFDTTVRVDPKTAPYRGKPWDIGACLKTTDNKSFWWDYSDSCAGGGNNFEEMSAKPNSPAAVTAVRAAPLTPTPHPQPATVALATTDVRAPFGPDSTTHRIDVSVDGKAQPPAFGKLGKWSTPTPDVIQLIDDTGTFRVLKPGAGRVLWTYADKEYEAKIQAQ